MAWGNLDLGFVCSTPGGGEALALLPCSVRFHFRLVLNEAIKDETCLVVRHLRLVTTNISSEL